MPAPPQKQQAVATPLSLRPGALTLPTAGNEGPKRLGLNERGGKLDSTSQVRSFYFKEASLLVGRFIRDIVSQSGVTLRQS